MQARWLQPWLMDPELGVEDLRICHQTQVHMSYVNHDQELGMHD